MKYLIINHELFGGFQVEFIDEYCDSIDNILNYVRESLNDVLQNNHLYSLLDILHNIQFKIKMDITEIIETESNIIIEAN
tara:strand:+ start:684 stop:923 length:240 start_codon:yes stop_codon:yes gene_type:complete